MASIRVSRFLIFASAILFANALPQKHDFRQFVTNKYLGDIGPVSDKNILDAFVRNNPDLPAALCNTEFGTRYLFPSVVYPDGRAMIEVLTSSNKYRGDLEVYFNGGEPINPNVIRDVINLSQANQSIRIHYNMENPTDKQIIDAFFNANNNLRRSRRPQEGWYLRSVLQVRRLSNRSALLYVDPPQSNIIGNSVVSW